MNERQETVEASRGAYVYWKKMYVFDDDQPVEAIIRNYTRSDFAALIQVQRESFPPPFPSDLWWNEEQLLEHVTRFPQGALCVEVAGEIVGSVTGLRMNFDPNARDHSWSTATGNGYIRTHLSDGDTLYIVDICVRPSSRKLGLGKWLMQSMYETVVQYGMTRLLGGARMPGYGKASKTLGVQEYVQAVVGGAMKDPVVTFLLRCGRTPVQVVPHYLEDEDSCNYGLLMEWRNPFI